MCDSLQLIAVPQAWVMSQITGVRDTSHLAMDCQKQYYRVDNRRVI